MPDRPDYRAKRVTEEIQRWNACAICSLWDAVPSLLALRVIGEPYDTVCNDCAISVLDLANRLVHVPIPRDVART